MDFLKVCPLTLVHVHGNNTLRLLDMRGNPSILEMTFANDPHAVAFGPLIPHPLTRRNNPNYRKAVLNFDLY